MTQDYLPTPHADSGGRLRAGYHWNYADCPMVSTEDLMHSPDEPARGLVPMPWRVGGPTSSVKHGYVEGSRAEALAESIGLRSFGLGLKTFGTVHYVEGPKANARTERRASEGPKPDALVQKLDKAADEAERLRAFAAQFKVVGRSDWLVNE